MLIETHAHLDFPEYNDDQDEVIKRANAAGVGIIINVASSLKGSFGSVALSEKYESIYATCGMHPREAEKLDNHSMQAIRKLVSSSNKVVAIGEVGLDFFRNISPRQAQYEAFVKFIKLSRESDLPLIIHCREEAPGKRDASELIFKAMRENLGPTAKGVMHCFSGDRQLLERALELGLHISFTCNITFKSASPLREVLKETPLDRLLLETDSPFLAPQAKRGERNEPSYLTYLVDAIAENLCIEKRQVEEATTENAKKLFNFRGRS